MSNSALHIVQRFFPEVTRVKDAKKSLQIEVTSRDTSSATVRNHKECAMAVACKRKFRMDGVIISIHTAYLIKGEEATRYQLPPSVSREVVSFDRNGGFAPGEYRLRVPSVALGRPMPVPQGKAKHPHKSSGFRHITEGIRGILHASEVS